MQELQQSAAPNSKEHGLTGRQWILLVFAFVFGIASVKTIDKVFLSEHSSGGSVHAAVQQR